MVGLPRDTMPQVRILMSQLGILTPQLSILTKPLPARLFINHSSANPNGRECALIGPYVFLFAGCTKEPYYNVRTSIEAYHMGEVE